MELIQVIENKKQYLELLLLADEEEAMIDKYLERGDMYALLDGEKAAAVCVITREGEDEMEIKNVAVDPSCQKRGLGKRIIEEVWAKYPEAKTLFVGTGDSPMTVPFYERCGFVRHHVIPNFFTDNYPEPIVECGITLKDMVVLAKQR